MSSMYISPWLGLIAGDPGKLESTMVGFEK
jgi:hypothetical protein